MANEVKKTLDYELQMLVPNAHREGYRWKTVLTRPSLLEARDGADMLAEALAHTMESELVREFVRERLRVMEFATVRTPQVAYEAAPE